MKKLTATAKIILNNTEKIVENICDLNSKGFNKIEVCFATNLKHQKAGLLPQQILIVGYRYTPRPDVHDRNVQNYKALAPQKVTWYLCSCGEEFTDYELFGVHVRKTGHYMKEEVQR